VSGPPTWFTREIGYGDEGDDVLIVQRKVDAPMTGTYDNDTAARVRGVQKRMDAEQTGVVDAEVAERLGEKATAGLVPEWFTEPCEPDCHCPAVAEIRRLVGQPNLPVYYDSSLSDAVRRFQSEHGLTVTGTVDEATAVALADRAY
jgi:peptidoglycan hydrolase-like protein with peptidoglycan-binding domain